MSENAGGERSVEKPWFPIVEGELAPDVIEIVLKVQSYHDAMSEHDFDRAAEIKAEIENDPVKFNPDLVAAMEEARKSGIRSRRSDQAQ